VSGRPPGYDERLARATADLTRLERRLRALSAAAWVPRRAVVLAILVQLADLSAFADGRERQGLPPIADHAIADALVVLGGDAVESLAAKPDDGILTSVIELLEGALEATR
jgi:hypothetical protein